MTLPAGSTATSAVATRPAPTGSVAAPRRRVVLLLEYDGTGFSGSQAQDRRGGVRTVQGVVEEALCAFTGERQRVAFAGRTDAGVHALGQVVALDTATSHDMATFRSALNHFLPEDVAVRAAAEVAAGLDPRRHAESRLYRFQIDDGSGRAPLRRLRAWQLSRPLDDRAMTAAAEALLDGPSPRPRDWAAFAGPVPDGYSTLRTLLRFDVRRSRPGRLMVRLEASGFLPQQVRRTVGALVLVGAGKLDAAGFARLADRPPGAAGPPAPPQGLTMLAVRYAPGAVEWGGCDAVPTPQVVRQIAGHDAGHGDVDDG